METTLQPSCHVMNVGCKVPIYYAKLEKAQKLVCKNFPPGGR